MSMSAVGFAPGVFQAAIPASGYADWVAMYDEQELRHVKLLEYELGSRDWDSKVAASKFKPHARFGKKRGPFIGPPKLSR